jgi:hypothetical protein
MTGPQCIHKIASIAESGGRLWARIEQRRSARAALTGSEQSSLSLDSVVDPRSYSGLRYLGD